MLKNIFFGQKMMLYRQKALSLHQISKPVVLILSAKVMFRVEITVKGQSRIVLTKIRLHD